MFALLRRLAASLAASFLLASVAAGVWAQTSPSAHKKLIEVGWDQPTPRTLRESYVRWEAALPFDGVTFAWDDTVCGLRLDNHHVLTRTLIPRAALAGSIRDLKQCRFRKFTDNFLRIDTAPGDLPFTDDKAWDTAARNLATAAWFLTQTGTRGIVFDSECYGAKQYRWNPAQVPTFARAEQLARKRGRQVMAAMAKENSRIRVLFFWGPSVTLSQARASQPRGMLAGDDYGLWPSFVNGLLDALPPGGQLIDGNEHGYFGDTRETYLALANDIRNPNGPLCRLMAPQSRAKWTAQVRAGLCVYLDAYLHGPDFPWYLGPTATQSRVERLRDNTLGALEASDEYVWVYGETAQWTGRYSARFDPNPAARQWIEEALAKSPGKGRAWEDALPGVTAALQAARDPLGYADKAIAQGRGTNLVVNGSLEEQSVPAVDTNTRPADWVNSLVPGYATWQEDGSRGQFFWDETAGVGGGRAARITGAGNGCFIQRVPVKAGETYLVCADMKREGRGAAALTVGWAKADGSFTFPPRYTITPEKDSPGWQRAIGYVRVPAGVSYITLLPAALGQDSRSHVWFDNLGIYAASEVLHP